MLAGTGEHLRPDSRRPRIAGGGDI